MTAYLLEWLKFEKHQKHPVLIRVQSNRNSAFIACECKIQALWKNLFITKYMTELNIVLPYNPAITPPGI